MIKASFLFFILVVIPFCVFEGTRFNSLYQSCVKIHYENEMLLIGTDCNAWERHKFAKKDKMCQEAELEQEITPFLCAWSHLWQQGEALRVWKMFTESYWMLLGITCFTIYMLFVSFNHKQTLSMQANMYKETIAAVKSVTPVEVNSLPAPQQHSDQHTSELVPSRPGDYARRRLV